MIMVSELAASGGNKEGGKNRKGVITFIDFHLVGDFPFPLSAFAPILSACTSTTTELI